MGETPSRSLPQGERPGHGSHLRFLRPECVKASFQCVRVRRLPEFFYRRGTFGMSSVSGFGYQAGSSNMSLYCYQVTVNPDSSSLASWISGLSPRTAPAPSGRGRSAKRGRGGVYRHTWRVETGEGAGPIYANFSHEDSSV